MSSNPSAPHPKQKTQVVVQVKNKAKKPKTEVAVVQLPKAKPSDIRQDPVATYFARELVLPAEVVDIVAPPTISEQYAAYHDRKVVAGKLGTDQLAVVLAYPRFINNLLYTSPTQQTAVLGTSNTGEIFTDTTEIAFVGGSWRPLIGPIINRSVGQIAVMDPINTPGSTQPAFVWRLPSGTGNTSVHMKIGAANIYPHEFSFEIACWKNGTIIDVRTYDLPNNAFVDVVVNNASFANNDIMAVQVRMRSAITCASRVFVEFYSNLVSGTPIILNQTHGNLAVTSSQVPERSFQGLCFAHSLLITNTTSKMYDGGEITTARLPPRFQPQQQEPLFSQISNISRHSRTGAFRDGSYTWNLFNSILDYRLSDLSDTRPDLPYLINVIRGVDVQNTNFEIIHDPLFIHVGTSNTYDWVHPPSSALSQQVLTDLAGIPACDCNGNHWKNFKHALASMGKHLKSPGMWKTGAEVAAFIGSLLI